MATDSQHQSKKQQQKSCMHNKKRREMQNASDVPCRGACSEPQGTWVVVQRIVGASWM